MLLEKLEKYYNDGLLLKQTHPYHDLTIWNYSPKVQYDRLWDEITMQCRGLVTNSEGKVIARPFKKFFNYEEYLENAPHMIPNEPFEVFEKMDGSLGILFNYNGEWILATRGSFTSDQAVKGKEILSKYPTEKLDKNKTYLFEILYGCNRIVVDYGDYEGLVLLAAYDNNTGQEVDRSEIEKLEGFDVVKHYNSITDYKQIKSMVKDNQEGFVIRFKNGFRMKIKGDEYCRLHKILTNISNRDIWEYLKDNKPLDDILDKVPDEFYNWVRETVKIFEDDFAEILGCVITDFWDIESKIHNDEKMLGDDLVFDDKEYTKKYAEYAKTKKYPHLLFSYRKEMLNPIKTSNAIWKLLYPDYQKPFKNDN